VKSVQGIANRRIAGQAFSLLLDRCPAVSAERSINEEFAQTTQFKGRIAHGMLTASVISAANWILTLNSSASVPREYQKRLRFSIQTT
jgi:hypothetical protein